VQQVVRRGSYRLDVGVRPNRAAVPNDFSVRLTRSGKPVAGADVTAKLVMLDMEMGSQSYQLAPAGGGLHSKSAPALVMVGRWGIEYTVEPPDGEPFDVLIVDHAAG
jgi:hypothetical protein